MAEDKSYNVPLKWNLNSVAFHSTALTQTHTHTPSNDRVEYRAAPKITAEGADKLIEN